MENNNLDFDFLSQAIMSALKKYNKMESSKYLYRSYKLSIAEIQYILSIQPDRKITMTDLAKSVSVLLSTATAMVDKLIKRGLVQRTRDEGDRRVVFIELSEEGKKVCNSILETRKLILEKLFSALNDTEQKLMFELLTKLYKKIDEIEL